MKEFTILVADDNEMNRKVLLREIERGLPKVYAGCSFKAIMAVNGQEAVDIVDSESIDLILMDVDMPVMDGLTATEKIKSSEKGNNIPVFAITAQAMKGDEEKCLAAGCNEYVSKPIDRQRLKELIGKWLKIS